MLALNWKKPICFKYYFNIYLNNDTPTMIKIMIQTPPPAAAPIIVAVFVSIFSVFAFKFSSFSNKHEQNLKKFKK